MREARGWCWCGCCCFARAHAGASGGAAVVRTSHEHALCIAAPHAAHRPPPFPPTPSHHHAATSAKGWGLHVWGDAAAPTDWARPLPPSGAAEPGGAPFFDVALRPGAAFVGAALRRGDVRAAWAERIELGGGDGDGDSSSSGSGGAVKQQRLREAWLVGDEVGALPAAPAPEALPAGSLRKAYACW